MKYSFLVPIGMLAASVLAGCTTVDTTGISPQSSKGLDPKSNAASPVLVQEYGDLQCPACRTAELTIVQPLLKELGSKFSLEFKQFPLITIHQYSMAAAEASECAADQGKFWPFVEKAYDKQSELDRDAPRKWAQELGLDMDLYDRCTKSHIKKKAILSEFEEGRKLGVSGTPTFFVNGKKVQNDLDELREAINALASSATGSKIRL